MATIANFIKRSKGYTKGEKTVEDTYQCLVDALNDVDAAIAAVEAKPVPTGYILDGVTAAHINRNPLAFETRATYRQSVAGGGATDPLDRPSVLSGSYDEWTEDYFIDNSATPKHVVNTAGDRFESFPQRKNGDPVLQITKNYSDLALPFYDSIKYTTNSGSVTIKGIVFAANTLLFLPPSFQEVYEQIGATTHHYFAVTFRLAADSDGHVHLIPNRGFKELNDDGDLVPILTKVGTPVETPWPLVTADGPNIGAAKPPGSTADLLEFLPYPEEDWGINFN